MRNFVPRIRESDVRSIWLDDQGTGPRSELKLRAPSFPLLEVGRPFSKTPSNDEVCGELRGLRVLAAID